MSEVEAVKFEMVRVAGEELAAANVDGTVWVSVRRMCEVLGLAIQPQHAKLSDSERAPWARITMMVMHDSTGRNQDAFCLELDSVPMWLATIDASRVRPEVRSKLVLFQREAAKVLRDHFLAPKPVPVVLMTRTEALRVALELSEKNDELTAQVAALAPKADFYDRVAASTNALSIGEVAKLLGFGRTTFFEMLRDAHIIEKFPSRRPYQEHLDAGRFVVKEGLHQTNNHGEQTHTTTYVTGKGQQFLAKRFGRLDAWATSLANDSKGAAS